MQQAAVLVIHFQKGLLQVKDYFGLFLVQPLQCKKAFFEAEEMSKVSVSCDKGCRPNSKTFNCGNVFR